MFELYDVIFEVYVQDQLVQRQTIRAPKAIIIGKFIQMAGSMKNDSRSMCIKMIRPETIWDPFEQKQKVLNNEIVLSNRGE